LWAYWARRGYLLEGREWLERVLALGGGTPERRATAGLRLGNLAIDLADPDRAEAMYRACLDARREMGDAPGVASSLGALGIVALHRGDLPQAEALLEDARARIDALDDIAGRARVRFNLARAALAGGDLARARALLDEAAAIRRDIGDANGVAYCVLYLAEVALAEGHLETAARLLDDARERFDDQDDCIGTAWATHDLGLVAMQREDAAGAEARFRDALAARLEHTDRQGVAETLEALATVAVGAGKPETGARLFASADAWRGVTSLARMPAERDAATRLFANATRALGPDALAAVTAAGRLASLEQVARDVLAAAPLVPVAPAPSRDYGLTPREREVLRLLAEGQSDREIADALFMAPRTVSWHVGHILAKFDVESRTAAASLAVREGLA
jgi:non-specific serine/threonine protein kinase